MPLAAAHTQTRRECVAPIAAFAFNRICCPDYRYEHAYNDSDLRTGRAKKKITCCVICCVCVYVCMCVSVLTTAKCHDKLTWLPIQVESYRSILILLLLLCQLLGIYYSSLGATKLCGSVATAKRQLKSKAWYSAEEFDLSISSGHDASSKILN